MAASAGALAPRGRGRAATTRGRRATRWILQVLLIAGALLAIGTPALAATSAVQGTSTNAVHGTSPARPASAVPIRATLTSAVTPALPSGVCQVPGIGDIGGLVGLCAAGSSGIVGDLNNICEPSLPQPEQATGGIDAMIEPPAGSAGGKTLYDNYGIAGQFWAAHGLQCSDMTSLIGNNVAGMVFDAAKSVDRVTITIYQSAAGDDILNWLQNAVDKLISALGNAIYFPYLAPVVILGAIWLAWQGLIRKRATRTIEGTLWMVVAATAAIALIGRPADFTGVGTAVSNGTTQVLNTAFSKLPKPTNSNCLPVTQGDPQSVTANYAFTSGNGLVDENANELWSVLVCKPWLYGELGTTEYATTGNGTQTVVNTYGRQLLWSQAIAANETPSAALIQAKQATYAGIASAIQQNNPAIYPLFQGNQWTTRLEIAFAAMFAALVAGLLILLIALTLIVLKLGFLLLLVAGPFFLIVGTHPGFGRVIAIRWFEMLVGVLMKQVAIAIVLSVLLYCYSLIMGTSDAVLPWALKILMITLVTVAVFIYRKPFQHLFSAVGYGTIGSQERAEYSLREASSTFRRSTLDAATVAIPGVAGYRAARWARRNPAAAAAAAATVAGGAGVAAGAAASAASAASADTDTAAGTGQATGGDAYAGRLRPETPPVADEDGEVSSGVSTAATPARGGLAGSPSLASTGSVRSRNLPEADSGGRTLPPLDLPPRSAANGSTSHGASNGSPFNGSPSHGSPSPGGASNGAANGSMSHRGASNGSGPSSAASGWSRGSGRSTSAGPAGVVGPRSRATSPGPMGSRLSGSSGAPSSNGSGGSNGTNGTGGSGGSGGSDGSGGSGSWPTRPAWASKSSTGSPGAGTRQRSGARPRPAAPPSESASADGGSANRADADEPRAMPFWLRPVRRDK
jgi:TrbL/VirB6 plasmid conjugal transfer protein